MTTPKDLKTKWFFIFYEPENAVGDLVRDWMVTKLENSKFLLDATKIWKEHAAKQIGVSVAAIESEPYLSMAKDMARDLVNEDDSIGKKGVETQKLIISGLMYPEEMKLIYGLPVVAILVGPSMAKQKPDYCESYVIDVECRRLTHNFRFEVYRQMRDLWDVCRKAKPTEIRRTVE